ncbi:hypothetical protein VNO77_35691 [Canavalia gladiata]|uniref:Uncharacterized protein n=1 Tax=Canavalia gladiata TaxID=3824 RepID=A0AAN9K8X6_CANGL
MVEVPPNGVVCVLRLNSRMLGARGVKIEYLMQVAYRVFVKPVYTLDVAVEISDACPEFIGVRWDIKYFDVNYGKDPCLPTMSPLKPYVFRSMLKRKIFIALAIYVNVMYAIDASAHAHPIPVSRLIF